MPEKRRLGKTEIEVTPVGLGCWQFGQLRGPMAFWNVPPQVDVNKIVKAALDGGINWFDTAEVYGRGSSERALSAALVASGWDRREVVIATKWWPFVPLPGLSLAPVPRNARSISVGLERRRECLAPCTIDLFQVHFPWSISSIEAQMDEMAGLVKAGKIRAVGVSNFSESQMRRAQAALAKRGLALASNQIRFNLLQRNPERNGVLSAAKEMGVSIIAYSPLGQGLLSGKFHKDPSQVKRLPFLRRMMMSRAIEKTRPVIKMLENVAAAHNCTAAEVALNWAVNFHGETVVAIPGATKLEHIQQNVGALNLKLTSKEMADLDEVSRSVKA